jgi:hypothetical protein
MPEDLCLYPDSGKTCKLPAYHDGDHDYGKASS